MTAPASPPIASKPTREAITFAFVAKAFEEGKGALHGLVPLFAPAVRARSGKLFEPQAIADEVNNQFDINVSPLVVTSMLPALVDEGLLQPLEAAGGASGLYRCIDPKPSPDSADVGAAVQAIFGDFHEFALAKLRAKGNRAGCRGVDVMHNKPSVSVSRDRPFRNSAKIGHDRPKRPVTAYRNGRSR